MRSCFCSSSPLPGSSLQCSSLQSIQALVLSKTSQTQARLQSPYSWTQTEKSLQTLNRPSRSRTSTYTPLQTGKQSSILQSATFYTPPASSLIWLLQFSRLTPCLTVLKCCSGCKNTWHFAESASSRRSLSLLDGLALVYLQESRHSPTQCSFPVWWRLAVQRGYFHGGICSSTPHTHIHT